MTPEIDSIARASGLDEKTVRAVLKALACVVASRDRTELRGLGAFTWRPYIGHPPGGRHVATEHLWFTSRCLYDRRRELHGNR